LNKKIKVDKIQVQSYDRPNGQERHFASFKLSLKVKPFGFAFGVISVKLPDMPVKSTDIYTNGVFFVILARTV